MWVWTIIDIIKFVLVQFNQKGLTEINCQNNSNQTNIPPAASLLSLQPNFFSMIWNSQLTALLHWELDGFLEKLEPKWLGWLLSDPRQHFLQKVNWKLLRLFLCSPCKVKKINLYLNFFNNLNILNGS